MWKIKRCYYEVAISVSFLFISINSSSQNKILYKFTDNRFLITKDNKWGVIDTLNNVIIPSEYNRIDFSNDRFILTKNKKVGLFDVNYQEIIPIKYSNILARNNNNFILCSFDDKDGLIDNNGKVIIPLKYKDVSNIHQSEKFYIVKNINDLEGVYDFNGNKILEEEYVFYNNEKDAIFASKGNESFLIDLNDLNKTIKLDLETKLFFTLRHYSSTEKFYQIVSRNEQFGILNFKNEYVIPLVYDEIKSSNNWKHFIIKKNNKYGLIRVDGEIMKQPIYSKINLHKGRASLEQKGIITDTFWFDQWNYFKY